MFDFGDGTNSANNSQNGGNGNTIAAPGFGTFPITASVDGVTLTISAVNTTSAETVTLGSNSQGWGVETNTETGIASTTRRIGGNVGTEAFELSFDMDVRLDSLRFGSFSNGEVALLEFVSGTNPFTTGTSTSITGTGEEGPAFDIPIANIGTVAAGTVLRLSASSPAGGGFLFNEITASDPNAPAGNLSTSIAATFPNPTLAENQNPITNLGSTLVAAGNSKGQSFSLPAPTSIASFLVEINSITTLGAITLDVYRAMDGTPWIPQPIFSDRGTLPAALAAGDLLQIDLPTPLDVERGSYTIAITGLGATSINLTFSDDALFPSGSAARNNSSTNGWERLTNADADLVFAVLGTQGAAAPAAPAGAPNIVFILADDLGWTDIQAGLTGPHTLDGANYGSDFYQTPNLARLAAEGMSFTHCFAHPNCAPTRAALLSGQYSARSGNGVYVVNRLNREAGSEQPTTFIPPSQREDIPAAHTISTEALQAGGYVTAHFGKYHVGNHDGGAGTLPENQGYDFNFGGQQNGSPGAYHASGQVFAGAIGTSLDAFAKNYTSDYIADALTPVANGNNPATLDGGNKHVEDGLADAAIAFMRDHRNGAMSARPFYLQLHNYAVHSPTGNAHARADLLTKYGGVGDGADHNVDSYAAILENMDQTIGRVMNYLDDPNGDGDQSDSIASNTLFIWTSDNGGHIGPTENDPMRHRKGSFYNGGIRVPLIVRQPGTVPAGTQTDTLVHCVDFYPTLIEAAGLTMPAGITFDGSSFATYIADPVGSPRDRDSIFYHFPGYLDQRARPCEVVLGRADGEDYKLIYTYDLAYTGNPSSAEDVEEGLDSLSENWELYKYSSDLSETDDLINGSFSNWLLYGEIATAMADELSTWLNQPGADWNAKTLTVRADSSTAPFPTSTALPAVEGVFNITTATIDFDAGEVTVTFPGEIGFLYDLQASNDLRAWTTIATDIPGAGPSTIAADIPDAGIDPNSRRFYQLVLHD